MGHWLGLDIGTSSLKALIVDDDGAPLARHSVGYRDRLQASPGVAEQDPQTWVDAAAEAIGACLRVTGATPSGIGLTGQVPTLVLVDDRGDPVRPAITWQDVRAAEAANALAAELGDPFPLLGTDLPWSPSHLPAKLRWIAEQEPWHRRAGVTALQPKDYLGLRLTGAACSDPWSSKGIVHVGSGGPATAVLAATGWDEDVVPAMAPPWTCAGRTTAGALGLPANIPVSVGWSDALASMLAVGAFNEPTAFVLTGTSEIVGISTQGDPPSAPGLYTVPTSVAPLGVLYGATQNGGSVLVWLSRLVGKDVAELLELAARGRADGPVFVPYLDGERAPLWDHELRGILAGLAHDHGLADVTRAVCRGVALSSRHVLSLAESATGARAQTLHTAGRAAAHPTWQQVWREIHGVDVHCHDEPFTAALGAAMLGAAAADGGHDLGRAARMRSTGAVVSADDGDRTSAAVALADYLTVSDLARTWAAR